MNKVVVNVFGDSPVQVDAPAYVDVIVVRHPAADGQVSKTMPQRLPKAAKAKGDGYSSVKQPDGRWLWTRPDGGQFFATFTHDAKRYETIVRRHKAAQHAKCRIKGHYNLKAMESSNGKYIESGYAVENNTCP